MERSSPHQLVAALVNAHTAARCMHIVADFGVADALEDEPASGAELARRTGLNADALSRILRLLVAQGVFAGTRDAYTHTPASRLLRSDHPQSMRSLARTLGMPSLWNGLTELGVAAKTGKPAGIGPAWSRITRSTRTKPHSSTRPWWTNRRSSFRPWSRPIDFTPYKVIADIAGGRAHLLQGILAKTPAVHGRAVRDAACDRRSGRHRVTPAEAAGGKLLHRRAAHRRRLRMMDVIHDWNDADSAKILAAIRKAAPKHARLLIVESLVGEEPGPHPGKTARHHHARGDRGQGTIAIGIQGAAGTGGVQDRTRHAYRLRYSVLEASAV